MSDPPPHTTGNNDPNAPSLRQEACDTESPACTEHLLTLLGQSLNEHQGPELLTLRFGPRSAATNTVSLLAALPAADILAGKSFNLAAVQGNPGLQTDIGVILFTVAQDATDPHKLVFTPDSDYPGALLAASVNSITVRVKAALRGNHYTY